MPDEYLDKDHLFLSTQPADRADRRLAMAAVLVSAIVFAALVPFAGARFPRVQLFLPIYQSALVVCDVATAVLLFGQFAIQRSRALLVLGSGYVFSASMAIFHMLSFPGLFSRSGLLGSGPQTTAWLYFLWHLGFPLAVIAYALMRDERPVTAPAADHRAAPSVMAAAAVAFAVAAGLMLVTTAGENALPPIMRGDEDLPAKYAVAAAIWLVTAAAVPALWRRGRPAVLDLWLIVVVCAWLCDVALSALFNVGRFSLGWYTGRIFGLLASSVLLALLIHESGKLYGRLAVARLAERDARRRAEQTAAELKNVNESLERRVAARTAELETEVKERARTEEALRQREARFRLFFVHSLEANFLTAPDGSILDANPAACELFGWTVEEFQARGRSGVVDVKDPRLAAALEERARTGRFRGELRMLRKDGSALECEISSVFFTDESGETRTHTVARDVTARKRAEAALREERNFMEAILGTTGALIVVMDTEGRIVRFNRACEEASGLGAEQVQGKTQWEMLVPAEEREGVKQAFEALRAGSAPTRYENHWQRPDGGRRLISWSNTCVRDLGGAIRYVIFSGIDITEQRRAEHGLLLRQADLVRLHRLQTMGALTAELAHELNQPLAAIANYADASIGQLERGADSGKLKGNLEKIVQQVERAARPIQELRRFLAKGQANKVPTEPGRVLSAACGLVERLAAARSVRLECEDAVGLPRVVIRPMQIEHVLVNLLQNAIDAVSEAGGAHGLVTLRAHYEKGERSVRVEVEDNGPGLDPALLERVFDPLYTTKIHGLGLGLAICRSIVEAHGGRIWAAPGPGGKFFFTLPVTT
jgi:PAS domain S-box-containing protein